MKVFSVKIMGPGSSRLARSSPVLRVVKISAESLSDARENASRIELAAHERIGAISENIDKSSAEYQSQKAKSALDRRRAVIASALTKKFSRVLRERENESLLRDEFPDAIIVKRNSAAGREMCLKQSMIFSDDKKLVTK